MELVTVMSVILILLGIVDTTDQKYGTNITLHDTALVSSTKQMPMNTPDTSQTTTSTASSVTTNQRWEISSDQKHGTNITLHDTALVSSTKQMPMNTPDTSQTTTSTASSVTTNQRWEISSGIWKIEWPEIRAGLIFGGVAILLTVAITILIIWKRGGSLYTCMRLGSRPKEEETIDLAQLKIARNKSHFSARDIVIDTSTKGTFQSSDDKEREYDGYLHPIGAEVENTERNYRFATYPRRKPATHKNVKSGDSVESEHEEPHWNRHGVNVHSIHTGIEADRTEYDTVCSTPSPKMSLSATDYFVRSVNVNEKEYDEAHSQHPGTEEDNTDYNIPGVSSIPTSTRSLTTNKSVQSGDAVESEYDEPHWNNWNKQEVNAHSVHTGTEEDNTDYNIPGSIRTSTRSLTTNKNVQSGDAMESEYDEPHWNKQEVNAHSVHTDIDFKSGKMIKSVIEMEQTDYYNCRNFDRNEEEENPYVNE